MKQVQKGENQMSIKKVYGAAIVQATASNPNGDPDNDGAPRKDINDYGMISPVAFKRRLRDSVARRSDAWQGLADELGVTTKETEERFQIYVLKDRKPEEIKKEIENIDKFQSKYWDARVFGNTILESSEKCGSRDSLRCGIVTVCTGKSLAPVDLGAQTFTRVAGIQEGKDRAMGIECHKYVEHAIYLQPFCVNPERAKETGVDQKDINVLLGLVPHLYDGRSASSAGVEVLEVWTLEFNGRSIMPIQRFISAISPHLKVERPTQYGDYEFVTMERALAALSGFAQGTLKEWVSSQEAVLEPKTPLKRAA
jgi:CRISPR-associated protein Csd2